MSRVALLINSLECGGAERTFSEVVRWMHSGDRDFDVVLLSDERFYTLPESITVHSFTLQRSSSSTCYILKFLELFRFALRLKRLTKSRGYAVVQSHMHRANIVNALAKYFGSTHQVQVVMTGQMGRHVYGRFAPLKRRLLKSVYAKTDLCVSKSQGMKRNFERHLSIKPEHVVINNPYSLDSIRSMSRMSIPALQGLDRFILVVGRLIPSKRNEVILKAIPAICKNNDDLSIVFLGEGPERERLGTLCVDLGIEPKVQFLGILENPYPFMAEACCLVTTSESEGFPNVLAEALICGCPVIAADCESGPREILAPNTEEHVRLEKGWMIGQYGILTAVGDTDALAEAVTAMLDDKQLSARCKNAGRIRALDFSNDIIMEQYEKVLYR